MEENKSRITMIHLLGFQTPQTITFLLFFLFFFIYCVTLCGNLLIITLVSYSKSLHSPMYFFLSQLSASDIILITDIVPNMLHAFLVKTTMISYSGCITQFYFFAVAGGLECFLLTAMSYDRYLAICKPLHYTLIMNHKFCWTMVTMCWTLSALVILNHTLTISKLQLCGPNIINHYFCDLDPILELSCTDTTIIQLEVTSLSAICVIVPFFIIIVSYVYIIITVFKIPSVTGRQKVFSTCSSHMTIVSIYYGTLVCVYLVPRRGQSLSISKFLSLLYTVVTPLLNPIIYSLRNQDLQKAVGKLTKNFLNMHAFQ